MKTQASAMLLAHLAAATCMMIWDTVAVPSQKKICPYESCLLTVQDRDTHIRKGTGI